MMKEGWRSSPARFSSWSSRVTDLNSLDHHYLGSRCPSSLSHLRFDTLNFRGKLLAKNVLFYTRKMLRFLINKRYCKMVIAPYVLLRIEEARQRHIRGKVAGSYSLDRDYLSWPILMQPSPRATLQGRPTVSEPPFRHYGNRFFECVYGCNFSEEFLSRTRSTGQPNVCPGGHFLTTPV